MKNPKARYGKQNGRYKHGKRIDYRARLGLKTNDGSVVHHKDGNRANNAKSNLVVLRDGIRKPGRRTTPRHEQLTDRKQGRKKKAS